MSQYIVGRANTVKATQQRNIYYVKNDKRRRNELVRTVKKALAFLGFVVQLGFSCGLGYLLTRRCRYRVDSCSNLGQLINKSRVLLNGTLLLFGVR